MEIYTREDQLRRNGPRKAELATVDERSLAQLLRDLSNDSIMLIRKEAELFRAETTQKLSHAQREAIVLGAGGLLAFVGLLALTAALILLLALAMPAWVSALIVGLAMAIGGAGAMVIGKNRLQRETLAPEESVRSVKTDVRMVREAVR